MMRKECGIYIHIPFCMRKCNYCDFLSSRCDEKTVREYVKSLVDEIKSNAFKYNNYLIKTIYIGGGTPSYINEEHIKNILDTLYSNYYVDNDAEITIEANPGTINKEKLMCYKQSKINRLSIGLQSSNNNELKLLGRIHTYEEFEQNYYLARECGFDNINIDLMSAIPSQTVDSYKESLVKICNLEPEHISSYSLILEEGTVFYDIQDKLVLPNEDEEREMYYLTVEYLKKNGYDRYEISNYCKKGYESKHNSSYWTGRSYIGFGLGASSYIEDERYTNTLSIEEYIVDSGIRSKHDVSVLSKQNKMEEFMFLGLRMTKGISKKEFYKKFDVDVKNIYKDVFDKYIDTGFIIEENDIIRLSDKGIDVSNTILAEFI